MTKEKSATELLEEGRKYREDLKLKADNGSEDALYNLATSYENGILINPYDDGKPIFLEKDEKKAFELYNELYNKDQKDCFSVKCRLRDCYEKGIGTNIDCIKAFEISKDQFPILFKSETVFFAEKLLLDDFIRANADRINKILQERKDKREKDEQND